MEFMYIVNVCLRYISHTPYRGNLEGCALRTFFRLRRGVISHAGASYHSHYLTHLIQKSFLHCALHLFDFSPLCQRSHIVVQATTVIILPTRSTIWKLLLSQPPYFTRGPFRSTALSEQNLTLRRNLGRYVGLCCKTSNPPEDSLFPLDNGNDSAEVSLLWKASGYCYQTPCPPFTIRTFLTDMIFVKSLTPADLPTF